VTPIARPTAALLIALLGSACSSQASPAPTSAAPSANTPAPASPRAASSADLTGREAPLLKELGGTYLCDERIYPAPPSPHLSAWGWAFTDEPEALAAKLAPRLVGAERDGMTFRFLGAGADVRTVLEVRPAPPGAKVLRCDAPPPGTRSLVVASRRGG
jgi:hypothetical protein